MIWLPQSAGFDDQIVGRLPWRQRSWLAALGALNLAAAGCAGLAGGYLCDLVLDSQILGVAAGVAVTLFWFNLLRLVVAAAGHAPHLRAEDIAGWRPPVAPLIFVTAFSLFFAQPVVAFLMRDRLDADAAEAHAVQRELRSHRVDTDFADRSRTTDKQEGGDLIHRFHALWRRPVTVGFLSLLAGILISGGALFRFVNLGAIRAYEVRRHAAEREFVLSAYQRTRDLVDATLGQFPGYGGSAIPPFEDPPFNRRPRIWLR
jgi:hypothetical protein